MALYTMEWLRDLPEHRRDALFGFDEKNEALIGHDDFLSICLAAANDDMTVREWLGVAIDIYLTDFEERNPGVLPNRSRYQ